MTFRGKYKKDHPGYSESAIATIEITCCPWALGYESIEPDEFGGCPYRALTCTECWNREMPVTNDVDKNEGG